MTPRLLLTTAILAFGAAAPAAASESDCAGATARGFEQLQQAGEAERQRAEPLLKSAQAKAEAGMEEGCWEALAAARQALGIGQAAAGEPRAVPEPQDAQDTLGEGGRDANVPIVPPATATTRFPDAEQSVDLDQRTIPDAAVVGQPPEDGQQARTPAEAGEPLANQPDTTEEKDR